MEDGHYKILRNENSTLSGVKVSKQYFANPTKNTNESWNYIGVNYVFSKEDTNYSIQVHYFTSSDYNNTKFLKEVDDRIEDDMGREDVRHLECVGVVCRCGTKWRCQCDRKDKKKE